MQCRVLLISCMRVTVKYSHNHSEEAAARNLYKLMTAERYSFPALIWSQKVNGVNIQKGHEIGIARIANGNVGGCEDWNIITYLHR